VHGIVEQSGGHIEVSSVEGTGTTFRIHLPIVDQAPEASIAAATSAASGGSERILVVEDEGPLRSLITQVLRRYGYTVLEAANGEEALALATRDHDRIWLLITDVVMPSGARFRSSRRLSVPRDRPSTPRRSNTGSLPAARSRRFRSPIAPGC